MSTTDKMDMSLDELIKTTKPAKPAKAKTPPKAAGAAAKGKKKGPNTQPLGKMG